MTKAKLQELIRSRCLVPLDGDGTECYCWTGRVAGVSRVPVMDVDGAPLTVRRLVYTLYGNRPALGKYRVADTCGNRLCCNPAHLVRSTKRASTGRRKLPAKTRQRQSAAARRRWAKQRNGDA